LHVIRGIISGISNYQIISDGVAGAKKLAARSFLSQKFYRPDFGIDGVGTRDIVYPEIAQRISV
jgi:hypothetical protein